MIKSILKFIFIGIVFYFLYFLQMSFFPFVGLFQFNFLFFTVLLVNILEDPNKNIGLFVAFFVGIFSDFFSPYFFGVITSMLLLLAILIKYLLLKYVRIR
ncbi:MAG: hypothetical protein PHD93_02895 [Candidatus Pacebacteria bacterium]|nr:hypothetical protein [Candidatus Paceibacterota bacterium]